MNVHHTLFNFRAWLAKQKKILQKCEEVTGDQPSIVRQLPGSKKTAEVVMIFVEDNRAEQWLQVQEQQGEQQREHRDQGSDLEEDRSKGNEREEEE